MVNNDPHIIPNVNEDIMRNTHSSAIDSTHEVLQFLCVDVRKEHGCLQTYHNCMRRVGLTIAKLVQDGRINNPPPDTFPSDWKEKDYLENALAENIHSFCLRVGRDAQAYTRVLHEEGVAWVRLQVVDNSLYVDVQPVN